LVVRSSSTNNTLCNGGIKEGEANYWLSAGKVTVNVVPTSG
jgi:hypothetical protein